MRWNKKLFPSLNVINGKSSPYGSKGVLRHDRSRLDPKLGMVVVGTRRITRSFHACTTILSVSSDSKSREAFNQPRYFRAYNCK